MLQSRWNNIKYKLSFWHNSTQGCWAEEKSKKLIPISTSSTILGSKFFYNFSFLCILHWVFQQIAVWHSNTFQCCEKFYSQNKFTHSPHLLSKRFYMKGFPGGMKKISMHSLQYIMNCMLKMLLLKTCSFFLTWLIYIPSNPCYFHV